MARLPVPGSDEGQWGQLLNDFLLQSHGADGLLRPDAVDASSLADGAINDGKLSAVGGNDGDVLVKSSDAVGGLAWSPSAQQPYPLEEGYGFHSASASPDVGRGTSWFTGWQVRVWVPAHRAIQKAGIFVSTAAGGTATFAGFAVYSDDGQTLLGQATSGSAFLAAGLSEIALTTPIAAQAGGHFVRVLVTNNYSPTSPECVFMIEGGPITGAILNSVSVRSAYFSALASFPASFNPVTGAGLSGWTRTNYLPIILLG
jgi:hypothetical protein